LSRQLCRVSPGILVTIRERAPPILLRSKLNQLTFFHRGLISVMSQGRPLNDAIRT